jgi:hypothetical protein
MTGVASKLLLPASRTQPGFRDERKRNTRVLLAGSIAVLAVVGLTAEAAAQANVAPNFQSDPGAWTHPFGGEFPAVRGSALPVWNDPAHPHVPNGTRAQPTYRIGDLSNPNLKPWVKDIMKKDNDAVLAGKIAYTPGQSCKPQGIPDYLLSRGPFLILQTPTKVVMVEEASQHARHIYLNVPHSENPKPSWLGESIGRYEGNTLVVDTVGLNTKTFVDSYRTPHSEKLHIVERWHLIDGGNMLEVNVTVDDPDTFYHPWQTYQRYQRGRRPITEDICQEGNFILFDYGIPVAAMPDF